MFAQQRHFFSNFSLRSRLSEILTSSGLFWQYALYWDFPRFYKLLTKFEIFRIFWLKYRLSKICDKIEIFRQLWLISRCFENFERNRKFRKFWLKSIYFKNFDSIILAKTKLLGFFQNLYEIEIFSNIRTVIEIFLNFLLKIKIFRWFFLKLEFFRNLN